MPDININFEKPIEKTTEQVIAEELIELCNQGAKQLVDLHRIPFNKLWNRTQELGADPQKVLDYIGSDGEKIFLLATELVTFILGGYGNTKIADLIPEEYVPPFSYTIQNGKIVLNK